MLTTLVFNKEGVSIESEVDHPLIGKKVISSDTFPYIDSTFEKFRNLGIVSIQPELDDKKEILRSLRFKVELRDSKESDSELKASQIIPMESMPSWKKSHVEGIDIEGRVGNTIMKHIKEKRKVTVKELHRYLKEKGVVNPETNGSVSEALVILRDDLHRIKQFGYGDTKYYEWIG
jgi:hypothetical protein